MAISQCIYRVTVLGIFINVVFTLTANSAEAITVDDVKTEQGNNSTIIAKVPKDLNFKSLDRNEDNQISFNEAINEIDLAKDFNNTDVNQDGVITVDEYAMYVKSNEKEINVN